MTRPAVGKNLTIAICLCGVLWMASDGFAVTVQQKVNTLTSQAIKYSKQGKGLQALQYINQAIKIQPRNQNLYYQRAFILGRAGIYSKAIQEFTRFSQMKGYPHAIRFRADCFMAVDDMRSAVKDYLTFLRKESKDGKVWSYLAEAYALMGDTRSALAAVNKGLSTGSHWSGRLNSLKGQILRGEKIIPHKPLSN